MRIAGTCVYNKRVIIKRPELLEATSMVKKYVLPCLIGLMSLFCLPSLASTVTAKATTTRTRLAESRLPARNEAVHEYPSEEEMPNGNLMVTATSSSKTTMGQSFTLVFSTGGQGWCDSTTSFLLAPEDEEFESYYETFLTWPVERREEITEQYERGEYEPVHFNSYVYSLTATSAVHDIVIPRSLTRNHIFNLDVSRLGVDLVKDWSNVTSITIPENVSEIYLDSFQNVPDTMVFNVEPAADLDGWVPGWNHGATVNYGCSYPEAKAEPLSKAGASKYGDEKKNYIIGWYPKEGEQRPLVLEYYVRLPNGELEDEPRFFDFTPSSSTSLYECVGKQVIDYEKSLYCDVPLAEGESIAFDSTTGNPKERIVLHNVYATKTKENGDAIPEPDFTQEYRVSPKQGYVRVYDSEDFINCTFAGLSTFSGFTSIDLRVDLSEANIYEHLKPNYYSDHLDEIKDGRLRIRYRLTSLGLCSFRVTYNHNGVDETKDVKIVTPVKQVKLNKQKGNQLSFLLKNSDVGKGFSVNSLRSVSFVSLYISLDLVTSKSQVARSNVITRFGYLEAMPYADNVKSFDINMMLVILAIAYIAAFIGGTIALYFFLKNKYKNDEFRRMKNKPFFTKAVLFLLGSMIVVFDIVFIVLRGTAFNNAIVVFNPVDAYIMVLSVLSIIILGYFVKYMVAVVKANRERRRIIKLRLNEDVEDNGTN